MTRVLARSDGWCDGRAVAGRLERVALGGVMAPALRVGTASPPELENIITIRPCRL